jgi:hypothetical protein
MKKLMFEKQEDLQEYMDEFQWYVLGGAGVAVCADTPELPSRRTDRQIAPRQREDRYGNTDGWRDGRGLQQNRMHRHIMNVNKQMSSTESPFVLIPVFFYGLFCLFVI